MKQYNRIIPGEHSKYFQECVDGNYIGTNFLEGMDLTTTDTSDKKSWKDTMTHKYMEIHTDKSIGTARNSIGPLWTVSFGLQKGDVILVSNGEGGYRVGIITGDYYYQSGCNLSHRRPVKWLDRLIGKKEISQELRNSMRSISTTCNITKYANEIEVLMGSYEVSPINSAMATPVSKPTEMPEAKENYKERDLHRLLSNYLLAQKKIFSKTIFHEKTSKKSDQNQKWIHPDMVGVSFSGFQDMATLALMKAADIKQYVDLYSFELKCSIQNDHELKESFFQALSNSNWANFGYLVAFEVNDDLLEEMERLNRAFGIGIIWLSPYETDTQILFPARKNDVDYFTIDKLCRINKDFKTFIERIARALNAQGEMFEDVKGALVQFCDKGFSSDEELLQYCNDKHIPLSN